MSELSRLSAAQLADGYRSGTISPVEVTRAALEAIDAYQDAVNAFVLVDADGALRSAAASEKRWRSGSQLGPADGIPTSIKDILLTEGWPTLRGSELISERGRWDEDAPAVSRLRAGGAVFVGKTTTPEFAWKGVTDSLRHGVTGNPWGAELTAGGSSGGSATAVGLGMSTWSVGTDGGGSVRIPASFTGTVACKATYGLVPHYPSSPFGTLAHTGPITTTVTDAALLLDSIGHYDARDWSALPTPATSFLAGLDDGVAGMRIAFSPTLGFVHNDPEVEAAVRAAAGVLVDAGALIDEVDPGFTDPVDAFELMWFTGAAKVLQAFGVRALDRIDPGLRRGIEQVQGATAIDYLDATAIRMALGKRLGQFHETYDVLLTPTMPIAAFPAGQDAPDGWPSTQWTSWTPYTYPFNMTQQPALSVPCGFTSDHRPIGLQVVGPRHGDAAVLRAGRAYEQATSWHKTLPTLMTGETNNHQPS